MPVSINATDVIRILDGEVGYHEGRANGHWNNDQKFSDQVPGMEWSDRQAWCDTFIVWGAWKAGDVKAVPFYAGCALSLATYRQWKRFSFYPAVGAQVFFGADGSKHTGIVTKWDKLYIWTVEGNTNDSGSAEGDGVYRKQYRRDNPYVYGYGYPKYDHAMDSADPQWKEPGKAPEKPTTPPPAKPKAPPFPGARYFVNGAKNSYAKQLQTWLEKGKFGPRYLIGPSETMTAKDIKKIIALQQHFVSKLGPADGVVGPLTWQYAWEVANGQRKK